MISLDTWVKVQFGGQDKLEQRLGLGSKTVNRWYNNDPRKFLQYISVLHLITDTPVTEIVEMVEQRSKDVMAIKGK
tara:strand:+ start:88 stop:315 length:228 start_codon:yes stop_codon:yes gene_type:complete